jgi:DNA primase
MRFPPQFIERLRSHFLMSEVIGKRLAIKKFGREYKAVCPFHNEKSPSFTVNDEKGFYHCFGCGAHGDAIEFVRRYDKVSYAEAIESLARDGGIPLPEFSPEMARKAEAHKLQHDVVEAACLWFEKQLHSASHVDALSYLEKRGLKPETVRQFRLGYAPDEKTALHQHLTKSGYSLQQQKDAGLVASSDSGQLYDRFRGRVIFPIRNPQGKVIAFGGRILDNNKNIAKYLNSPETELFKKGDVLYNLDLAKRAAADAGLVVVMEGYMDVVSTTQSGVGYAVATLGTAVTPEHLRLLWRMSKEPVLCLDGDVAGKRAMMRAAEIALPLITPGFSLRFAVLPKGEDPDTYIQKHGKESFEKLLGHSKRLSQVLWETMAPQYKLNLAEGRAALEGAMKKLAEKIADPMVKQHFISYFKKQLWETASQKKPAARTRSTKVEQMAVQHYSTQLESLIKQMLKTIISFPSLLQRAQVEEFISHMDIRDHRTDSLRTALVSLAHQHFESNEAFHGSIMAALPEEWFAKFMAESLKLPYRQSLSDNDALVLWNETMTSYQIVHMQQELEQIQYQSGAALDEAAYQRLVELQNAIKTAQTTRTFAPMATDVA